MGLPLSNLNSVKIPKKRALEHLFDLLSIEGISGEEEEISQKIREKLLSFGCNAHEIFYDKANSGSRNRFPVGNLVLKLPGTFRKSRRLFISHMDTVPLCRNAIPNRKGNRIIAKGNTGLGADNRTGVSCLLTVIEAIVTENFPHPPLTFLFSIGEEVGLFGAKNISVASLGRPRFGFNVDSGNPEDLIIGASGADRWEFEVLGLSSHAGVHPEDGISASLITSIAISDVAAKGYFGRINKRKGTGTSNIGIIRGGEVTNQVSDYMFVRGESRSFNADFIEEINRAYQKAFEDATRKVRNSEGKMGVIKFKTSRDYEPFLLEEHDFISVFSADTAKAIGLKPKFKTVNGGLDASALNAKGIPTITIGAGQHNAHTPNEYVDIQEYLRGCRLALALAL